MPLGLANRMTTSSAPGEQVERSGGEAEGFGDATPQSAEGEGPGDERAGDVADARR